MKPKSVNLAEMLGWVATGLGALSILIMLAQALGVRFGIGAGTILSMLFLLVLYGALGLATFYFGKRRHEVGRWGFVVIGAFLALRTTGGFGGLSVDDGGLGILFIFMQMLSLAAILAAIVALVLPETQAWFAQGPIMPAPRPVAQAYPGYGTPPAGAPQYPAQPGYPPHGPAAAPGYPPQPHYPPAPGLDPAAQPPQPGYAPDGTPLPGHDPGTLPPRP